MTAPVSGHAHTPDELPPPTIEEVSPGIYAYIQLDGSWGLNNTGFITGSDAVSLVDTCFTEARTRAFLGSIANVTDLPIRTLVNTHHHGDHTHGNYLLPGASIVGHELYRQTVIDTGLHTLHPLFLGVVWGDLELAPPFITFQDRLDLYVDDLKLELHYMGPAHTTNDVVVWVPERRLLFTGDLVFNGGTPFVAMGLDLGLPGCRGPPASIRRRRHRSRARVGLRPGSHRRYRSLSPLGSGNRQGDIFVRPVSVGRCEEYRPGQIRQLARHRAHCRKPPSSVLGTSRGTSGRHAGPRPNRQRYGYPERRRAGPLPRLEARQNRSQSTCVYLRVSPNGSVFPRI